jgi:hypothetical protein
MAQSMSFVGKERKEPAVFIKEGGLYRLKIAKHEVDGYTNEGNEKHKYTFKCNKIIKDAGGKPALSQEIYSLNSTYNGDEKQEWVFMNLIDALKVATAFDPASLVGYYLIGEVEMKAGFTNPDKKFASLSPYGYRYSKMNDNLPPVPKFKEQQIQSYAETPQSQMPAQGAVIEIDEEEIPF